MKGCACTQSLHVSARGLTSECDQVIAGEDWVPLSRRQADRRTPSSSEGESRTAAREEEIEEAAEAEAELAEGEIDFNTYGLEELDEDEDPRHRMP